MTVNYSLDGDVAVLALDRPDRFNAIDAALSRDLVSALGRAGSEARAVVLTGRGKAFCAGADLGMLDEASDLGTLLDEVFHPMVEGLAGCPIPTVGAINGVAAGAGLGLALGCDMRVMAESATLTSAFTAIGLAPDSGTTWWLPHLVGVSRAIEIAFTNRRIPADEAMRIGLCSEVAPDDQLAATAMALARSLADLVPDSLVTTRRLIRDAAGSSFAAALTAERAAQARLGATPEHHEGVTAFKEKRRANFRISGD
jgi:2-(1,2-epoxy-1,2-dihydrophenyl)acetyl-CoA isomerase